MKLTTATLPLFLALVLTSCTKTQPAQQAADNAAPGQPAAGAPAGAQQAPGRSAFDSSAPPPPVTVELPPGTHISVRLDQALSTARNRSGDTFTATLEEPLSEQGQEVLPQGTKFNGHVMEADASGRLQGRAVLGITLDSFELNGQTFPLKTSLDTRTSEAHKKRNIELIGGGAGLGGLIGAVAGHGKGALIGAAAGAAAGTGTAAATGKLNVEIPAETVFRFKLEAPLQLQAPPTPA